jgi:hypothetical protein
MKTRIIYPQLWLDEKFASCKAETKLLFMYLITSPHLGLSVYSRISDRKILFDTGLNKVQTALGKKELEELRWCFFKDEWIFHNHKCAYVDYAQNDRVAKSKAAEIATVPEEIVQYFDQCCLNKVQTPVQTPFDPKSEIINKNTENNNTVNSEKNENEELIVHFNEKFNKGYVLTKGRSEMLRTRRKTYTQEQIIQAIDNLSQDPFYTGKNDRRWVADPDYLFRNDENIDKAINLRKKVTRRRYSDMID